MPNSNVDTVKIDDNTVDVSISVTSVKTERFTLMGLKNRKTELENHKTNSIAQHQKAIDEITAFYDVKIAAVDEAIQKAIDLGIVEKEKEVVIP